MYKAIIAASIAVLTAAEEAKQKMIIPDEMVIPDEIIDDEPNDDEEVLGLDGLLKRNQEESYSLMDQQEAVSLSQVDLMTALFEQIDDLKAQVEQIDDLKA